MCAARGSSLLHEHLLPRSRWSSIATDGPACSSTSSRRDLPHAARGTHASGGRDEEAIAAMTWRAAPTSMRRWHSPAACIISGHDGECRTHRSLPARHPRHVDREEDENLPRHTALSWHLDARPGSLVTYFEQPSTERRSHGDGAGHHYALAVANEAVQLEMRSFARRRRAGVTALDRVLQDIYTRDPDGHIVSWPRRPGVPGRPLTSTGTTLRRRRGSGAA